MDENGQPIPGVSILLEDIQKGTTTKQDGTYSLALAKGEYRIKVSFLGFQTQTREINLIGNR